MKPHSVKFKITCWYTLILTLVFAAVLGGVFVSSEFYSEDIIKTELLDEVKDLQEEMLRYPEHFSSSIVLMIQHLKLFITFVLPLLILFTAFMSYRLVQRSHHPVSDITNTVNEITDSSDLSLRLPESGVKDEFSHLTETFNRMLNHLEQQFLREQEFSSDATHELRTPVSIILSHCEYSLAKLEMSPDIRKEFLCIQAKALQMSQLVSHLLDIARAESSGFHPAFEEVNLEILAESAADELAGKAAQKERHDCR